MTHPFRVARFIVRNPQEQSYEHASYAEGLVDANGRKVGWSFALQNARSFGSVVYEADAAGNERVVRDYR